MNGDNVVIPRRDPPKLGMQLVMFLNVWELWCEILWDTGYHRVMLAGCVFFNGMMADNTKKNHRAEIASCFHPNQKICHMQNLH